MENIDEDDIEICVDCKSAVFIHTPECKGACEYDCNGEEGFKLADKYRAVNGQFGCEECKEDI